MKEEQRRNSGVPPVLIVLGGAACLAAVCCGIGAVVLLPAIQSAREAARRQQAVENLKNLSAALRSYHETHAVQETQDSESGPGASVEPAEKLPEYTRCQAVLADYQEEYAWFENWTENGHIVHDHGNSPRALFVISEPAKYAGREVGVLLKQAGATSPAPPGESDEGMAFSLELPDDFLAGDYATIDYGVIRNLSRHAR